MKRTFTALALVATLMSGAAFAQGDNAAMMDEGLSMLELAVTNELARLGIQDADAMSLSLSQLAEIRAVVSGSGYNENEKKQQIETIMNR